MVSFTLSYFFGVGNGSFSFMEDKWVGDLSHASRFSNHYRLYLEIVLVSSFLNHLDCQVSLNLFIDFFSHLNEWKTMGLMSLVNIPYGFVQPQDLIAKFEVLSVQVYINVNLFFDFLTYHPNNHINISSYMFFEV